jgi:hypothetical protein
MTGSIGICILLALAWSRKFNPMQTILLEREIADPKRTDCAIRGTESPFSFN